MEEGEEGEERGEDGEGGEERDVGESRHLCWNR